MYAVIRIRGSIGVSPKIKKTFELLNLRRVNNMSIWQENKQTLKMIKIVENHATFGIINEDMIKEVITKRGNALEDKIDLSKAIKEVISGKTIKEAGLKNCFRLSPPKKGHARKGVKKPFSIGGALGNRKEKINELIERML